MKLFLCIPLIYLIACPLVYGNSLESKTFTSDGLIQDGEIWGRVNVYDTPPNHTTVTMTGGSVTDAMNINDAAAFNMSAGDIGGLSALYESTVNITGGSTGALSIYDTAVANISENTYIDSANALRTGVINMNGGMVFSLGANENSIINLRDGIVTYLGANSSALINIYGGHISQLSGWENSTINVFGFDLIKTNTGGTYGVGQITGFWLNGSPLLIEIGGLDASATINLIPEPATLLLLGLGIVFFKGR